MYEIFLALLKERGMKVADFCRATGVTQSSISSWKNRGGIVGSKLGQIIADYFEIPIDYLAIFVYRKISKNRVFTAFLRDKHGQKWTK